mmetsp:Transcript_42560/g.92707  ORF Transcript_42560/g.92707 Transcript_42560/m.92707 type:complete len:701 (-) Transcript_42560:38-2140(-)
MVARCQRGHFVPVDRVIEVEVLDLLRDLLVSTRRSACPSLRGRDLTLLCPHPPDLQERGERTAMLYLAAMAEISQLSVGHAHVVLIALHTLRPCELRAWLSIGNALKYSDALVMTCPNEETLQVSFVDAANGVDVRSAAVILCVVTTQGLVDVCGTKNQKAPCGRCLVAIRGPWHELCHEVAHDHSTASLDILQGQVLICCAIHRRLRLHLGLVKLVGVDLHAFEGLLNGRSDLVNVDGRMDGSDVLGQVLSTSTCFVAAILGSHVACHEDLPTQVLCIHRGVVWALRNFPHILQNLFFASLCASLQLIHDPLTHNGNECRRRGGVCTARQGQEVASLARAPEVVPKPGRGAIGYLLHGVMDPWLYERRREEGDAVRVSQGEGHLDARHLRREGGLVGASTEVCPEAPHVHEIHRGRDNLNVIQGPELTSLRHHLAVHPDHAAAVEVEPAAVAALLVGIEVDTPGLRGSSLDKIYPLVQFSELVVAARAVGYDLHAVQAKLDVRRIGCEQLLAGLGGEDGVARGDCEDPHGHLVLPGDLPDVPREVVFLERTEARGTGFYVPGCEVPHLPVIAVVGHEELGPDPHDPPVQAEDAAVVRHIPVHHWHADVAQDAIRRVIFEELGEGLPAMVKCVKLQEGILAAVTCYLELGPCAECAALLLGLSDGLPHTPEVALEVHGPLVEVACGQLDVPRHPLRSGGE